MKKKKGKRKNGIEQKEEQKEMAMQLRLHADGKQKT